MSYEGSIEGTEGFIRNADKEIIEVGARSEIKKYNGPVAECWLDLRGGWVHIETDPYEASVMVNLEALPHLIEALNILKARADAS